MNYVDNKKLLKEITIYIETGHKSEELGRMLLLISEKYAEKGSFSGYSWKDDMCGEAVLTCVKYMHNFDLNVDDPNPFAYLSRIVHNAFLNFISRQKRHSAIKDICYKNIDFLTQSDDSPRNLFDVRGIDYQSIRGYKKKKKKRKRKKKNKE